VTETIINKLLPKINKTSAIYERVNTTVKVGDREIVTPVLQRNLSGIMTNLLKYFKGGDVASFFHDLMLMIETTHQSTMSRLCYIDEWFKSSAEKKLWDLYTSESIFKGIMVIIGVSNQAEKLLLIKHCQKYFNLMDSAHITTATDMEVFVETNDTLINYIRKYVETKENIEKLNFQAKSDDKKQHSKDTVMEQLSGMSQSKLNQILSQMSTDENSSIPQSQSQQGNNNNNNHKSNKPPQMNDTEVQAHMASGTIVDKGLTMYPIKRTNMTYPLYATIKEANLKSDVTSAENIHTREKDQTYPYESYKDKANLPGGDKHFSNGYKCKRCKGYGHFYQRCLQEKA
jgi:hypothetical protein